MEVDGQDVRPEALEERRKRLAPIEKQEGDQQAGWVRIHHRRPIES
jgi:hypothetical protein